MPLINYKYTNCYFVKRVIIDILKLSLWHSGFGYKLNLLINTNSSVRTDSSCARLEFLMALVMRLDFNFINKMQSRSELIFPITRFLMHMLLDPLYALHFPILK